MNRRHKEEHTAFHTRREPGRHSARAPIIQRKNSTAVTSGITMKKLKIPLSKTDRVFHPPTRIMTPSAFVSLRDNLDLSTAFGRLMFQIIGAMAEFERALISERVSAGLR